MKPIAIVALNVVTVAVALVAYDVLRSGPDGIEEPQARSDAQAQVASVVDDALDERLRSLESDRRRVRRPGGTAPDIVARLEALEAALVVPAAADHTDAANDAAVAPAPVEATAMAGRDPTPAEIKRFRQMQEAVRREDAIERNKKRIDAALDALPLNLTEAQRAAVHTEYAAFQPRVGEIWGTAKAEAQRRIEAGGQVDRSTIVADTTAVIQQEFAATLSAVVSQPDAMTIAGALLVTGK